MAIAATTGRLTMSASASTDRVVIVDTQRGVVTGELLDSIPGGPGEGSTPNALALSADGRTIAAWTYYWNCPQIVGIRGSSQPFTSPLVTRCNNLRLLNTV